MCVAKNKATIYDMPSTYQTVVRTLTKKDGWIMTPLDDVSAALKGGWLAVDLQEFKDPDHPTLLTSSSGYVKASEIQCLLGGPKN